MFFNQKLPFDSELLSKLQYISACIKETLRICPAVPAIARRSTKDIKVPDGRIVPRGTFIFVRTFRINVRFTIMGKVSNSEEEYYKP